MRPAWLPGRIAALFAVRSPRRRKAVPVGDGVGAFFARLAATLALTPARLAGGSAQGPGTFAPEVPRKGRVVLLQGCAQAVLAPSINEATVRLLTRQGIEVVLAAGEGCCGSLVHHMGREAQALAQARANIDVWTSEIENGGLDAIIVTASGCGTTIKDYGFMLRGDAAYAEKAARVSALARDISEYLAQLGLGPPRAATGLKVAYQSACSLQHGQKIHKQPKDLLAKAGFRVSDIAEAHLCCGSAGTYNIMQPDIAARAARPQGRKHRAHRRRRRRDRQHRLHDTARAATALFRSCTPSSFSTGRMADRCRARSWMCAAARMNSRRIANAT